MKDVTALIDDILAIDDLLPSTKEDLEDFKRDFDAGELNKDDREYIAALHERLVGGSGVASPAANDDGEDDDDDEDDQRDEIETLDAEIEELKAAIAERDARIDDLECKLLAAKGSESGST